MTFDDRSSRLARAVLKEGPRVVLYTLLVPVVLFGACLGTEFCCALAAQTPDVNPEAEWKPRTYDRCELELRSLPLAAEVLANYARWTSQPSAVRSAKLYLLRMPSDAQRDLRIQRLMRDGLEFAARPPSTRASFEYVDARGEKYAMLWHLYGWHWPGFLKLESGSRRMLVAPIDQPPGSMPPVLFIHGIEGVQAHMDAPGCTPLGVLLPTAARAALAPPAEPSGPHTHACVPSQFATRAESPERLATAARVLVAGPGSGGNARPCAASRSIGRPSPEP
jgi:hypothetical protein